MSERPKHRVSRESYGVVYREEAAFKDTYGGEPGSVFIECMRIVPEGLNSDWVMVFSHPVGGGAFLPIMGTLARIGVHVLFVNPRYRGNDSALIMEKCVSDLGAAIADAKQRFGYERVVLGGWSGGGSLALFYQEQAVRPSIKTTPAGDPLDLAKAELPAGDALILIAAHVSRSVTLTEWLDPSITDEHLPFARNPALDLYAAGGVQPPYTESFLAEYRSQQIARNRRITAWVQETLVEQRTRGGDGAEFGFVVHGTMADPRWLDASVDPNERVPGTCYLGDPEVVNMSPVGLARFCTLRSWLSQWSFDESRAHGERNGANVTCPALVIGNMADNACTPSHTHRLYEALASSDKTMQEISGATHYYAGQPDKCAEAAERCQGWLASRGFA